MRVFRLPLFVGLLLLTTAATAQVFGGNPPSLKWRQLNTDTARIIFPMGEHLVFPRQLGRVHPENGTPHVAITVYALIMLAIPTVLELVTNPLTTFGDVGTLAAENADFRNRMP